MITVRRFFLFKIFLINIIFSLSCSNKIFYKKIDFLKTKIWNFDNSVTIEYESKNLNCRYNVYLVIIYTSEYEYNNIHMLYEIKNLDNGKIEKSKVNSILFDPKTGIPHNRLPFYCDKNMQEILILHNAAIEPGKYQINIKQIMRKNDLVGIVSVGIKIVPVNNV